MRRTYIKKNGRRYTDDFDNFDDAIELVNKNKGRGYIVEVGNFLHSNCVNG